MQKHNMDRIIYVIPYTSIIEQNAQIFKDILGEANVLEDHCNVVLKILWKLKPIQLASENWDCPIVVTTNVQFLNLYLPIKPQNAGSCIISPISVIIFDEAQMPGQLS